MLAFMSESCCACTRFSWPTAVAITRPRDSSSSSIAFRARANRSLTHFVENSIPVALLIALSGAVFPFPTFVCTVVFAVGRVLHQTAYAAIGYGPHGLGFAMSDTAKGIMMSFCLIAADKSLGLGMFEYGFAMAAKADAKASAAMGADHPWVLDAANGYVDAGVAYAATSFETLRPLTAAYSSGMSFACGSVSRSR